MTLEYGKGWSEPEIDHFAYDRAVYDYKDASDSKFLHPVFYFYYKIPSSKLY